MNTFKVVSAYIKCLFFFSNHLGREGYFTAFVQEITNSAALKLFITMVKDHGRIITSLKYKKNKLLQESHKAGSHVLSQSLQILRQSGSSN